MHEWGEENVDWNGIDSAAEFIRTFCTKYARLGGQSKEKYGTVRFYCHIGYLSLHTLVYPGYVYNQFPDWLWKLDCKYIQPVLQFLFGKAFAKWQLFVYTLAYKKAIKKWPHLEEEITSCMDYPEVLE